jgi:uncharacterized membrane protein YeiH
MGGLIAFGLHKWLHRLTLPLTVLDAAGLSLFAVTGASNALDYGLARPGPGDHRGRDHRHRRRHVARCARPAGPGVLQSGSNAIPAIIGASITVAAILGGAYGVVAAVSAATVCFLVRMLGVVLRLNAPEHAPEP